MKLLIDPDKVQTSLGAALRGALQNTFPDIIPCIKFKGDAASGGCREACVAFSFLPRADSHPLAFSNSRHVRHCHKLFDGYEFCVRDSKFSV